MKVLLLCEVALGRTNETKEDWFGENTKYPAVNKDSTWARGVRGPDPNGSLVTSDGLIVPCGEVGDRKEGVPVFGDNEYVVYDEARVRVRYLVLLDRPRVSVEIRSVPATPHKDQKVHSLEGISQELTYAKLASLVKERTQFKTFKRLSLSQRIVELPKDLKWMKGAQGSRDGCDGCNKTALTTHDDGYFHSSKKKINLCAACHSKAASKKTVSNDPDPADSIGNKTNLYGVSSSLVN